MQQDAHFPGFAFGFRIDGHGDAEPLPSGMADGDKEGSSFYIGRCVLIPNNGCAQQLAVLGLEAAIPRFEIIT